MFIKKIRNACVSMSILNDMGRQSFGKVFAYSYRSLHSMLHFYCIIHTYSHHSFCNMFVAGRCGYYLQLNIFVIRIMHACDSMVVGHAFSQPLRII